jgi:hypothetical protein
MTGELHDGASLADILAGVWSEQGHSGFLLTDPEEAGIEIREVDDPISQVRFRFRWLPHRELRTDVAALEARGILDPRRDESALFRDPRDPSGRFCFLCAANIRECNPMEQLVEIHLAGRDYFAGANFAWISREHFTVMAADHTDQVFSRHSLQAMLDLHAQTDGRFRVIYNAPDAGATIPWHLHYQVTSDAFPVEALPAGNEAAYPAVLRRFTVEDGGAAALAHAAAWMAHDVDHHRVNVLVAGPAASPTVHVFARDIRRSHAAEKGLMGGFEVCGDFVYSEPDKRGGFESASADLARSLLIAIRPAGT